MYEEKQMRKEELIFELDNFGKFQKLICGLLFVYMIPTGFITMIIVFLQYTPPHHCTIPIPENDSTNFTLIQLEKLLNASIPWEVNALGITARSQCLRYTDANNIFNDTVYNETTKCDKGWTYDSLNNMTSTVTEWEMVCSRSWIKPMISSIYIAGIFVGSLAAGVISDRYGRKTTFLWGSLGQFLSLFLLGFSNGVEMFSSLVFVMGAALMMSYLAAFLLGMEIMNPKHRALAGTVIGVSYSVGYMMLPGISYLIPDWRWLARTIGLLGLLYIPCYWLFPESPRWLISTGRNEEAKILLKKISKINGSDSLSTQNEENITLTESKENEKGTDQEPMNNDNSVESKTLEKPKTNPTEEENKTFKLFCQMLRNSKMRKRTLIICLSWFCIGAMYYCISLNTDNLGENIYIYCFISGAVEIPAGIISLFLMNHFGRTVSMFSSTTLGGLSYGLVVLFNQVNATLGITFAMISKFLITVAFCLIYVQTGELYPTLVRQTSFGVASTICRIGSIVVPYIIYAGTQLHFSIPYISMGILCVGTGMTSLMLPETKGEPIPETLADAINLDRYAISCCGKRTKREAIS